MVHIINFMRRILFLNRCHWKMLISYDLIYTDSCREHGSCRNSNALANSPRHRDRFINEQTTYFEYAF